MLVRRCGLPVQCVVPVSVSLSAGDQMLKYGSHATSGTDGGRKVSAPAEIATIIAARKKSGQTFKRLVILFFMKIENEALSLMHAVCQRPDPEHNRFDLIFMAGCKHALLNSFSS